MPTLIGCLTHPLVYPPLTSRNSQTSLAPSALRNRSRWKSLTCLISQPSSMSLHVHFAKWNQYIMCAEIHLNLVCVSDRGSMKCVQLWYRKTQFQFHASLRSLRSSVRKTTWSSKFYESLNSYKLSDIIRNAHMNTNEICRVKKTFIFHSVAIILHNSLTTHKYSNILPSQKKHSCPFY